MTLDTGTRHLLRLTLKGAEDSEDGWAPVSEAVWPLVAELPSELIESERLEDGGRARLTADGRTVLEWT